MPCVVRPSYEASTRLARNNITVFYRNGGWEGVDLVITQRCYSEPELRCSLQVAGFGDIVTHDGEHEFGMTGDSGRMFFLASHA